MNNIIVQDVGTGKDTLPYLRRSTWVMSFSWIAEMHPRTDVVVVSLLPECYV